MRAADEEQHRQALATRERRRTVRQAPKMPLAGRADRRAEGSVRSAAGLQTLATTMLAEAEASALRVHVYACVGTVDDAGARLSVSSDRKKTAKSSSTAAAPNAGTSQMRFQSCPELVANAS